LYLCVYVQGATELTTEEKTAARRAAKRQAKKDAKQKDHDMKLIAKLKPGLGNKYATNKAVKELQTKKQRVCSDVGCRRYGYSY
jgi:hypothetical protein